MTALSAPHTNHCMTLPNPKDFFLDLMQLLDSH